MRILFWPDAGPRGRRWLTADDFTHDGRGEPAADELEIEAEIGGLTDEELARMVTCLAPSLGPRGARLRLRAQLSESGRIDVEWFGGDSQHPDVERWAREAVTFTYLHPLRDAAGDLRPGRANRLVDLIASYAPDGHEDRKEIERVIAVANKALDAVPALGSARDSIQTRLQAIAGDGEFVQQSSLAFADPQFERIVATLRAMAGHLHPLEMRENGLGYNNLLYIAVLLAALSDPDQAALRVLLVEEPEAHLHPQLQDLLMRYLEEESGREGSSTTQVIVTSHSPNFASAARVERVTVLTRSGFSDPPLGRTPRDFDLTSRQLSHLRRFLDVTKASLLFARRVVLVEGIAEQLLVPVLAQRLGISLSAAGVSVINVGGVSFPPFAALFGKEKLPSRCVIISDGDPPAGPTEEELEGGDRTLSAVSAGLKALEHDLLRVELSIKTLEWDLASPEKNWPVLLDALEPLKPRVVKRLRKQLAGASAVERSDELLNAVSNIKGPYAQRLSDLLLKKESPKNGNDNANTDIPPYLYEFVVPPYIESALQWLTSPRPANTRDEPLQQEGTAHSGGGDI